MTKKHIGLTEPQLKHCEKLIHSDLLMGRLGGVLVAVEALIFTCGKDAVVADEYDWGSEGMYRITWDRPETAEEVAARMDKNQSRREKRAERKREKIIQLKRELARLES